MTDHDAFLAAIRAAPDDDLAREVYADWLDDHGEPDRAAFIRAAVELAGLRLSWLEEAEAFAGRGAGPRAAHAARLVDALRDLAGPHRAGGFGARYWEWFARDLGWADAHFVRRGFVDEVVCDATAWCLHGDAALARHPVRTVRLTSLMSPLHTAFDPLAGAFRVRVDDPAAPTVPVPAYAGPGVEPAYAAAVREAVAGWLARRWPGVAFELPPPAPSPVAAAVDRWVASVARSAAVLEAAGARGRRPPAGGPPPTDIAPPPAPPG